VRTALIAGVDIGNTTTEIVLADVQGGQATPVARGSVLTAGTKGAPASVKAAWRLLDRLERSAGSRCRQIAIADAIPVQTGIRGFVSATHRSTRLLPLDAGAGDTRSGHGVAVGRPVWLADVAAEAGSGPGTTARPARGASPQPLAGAGAGAAALAGADPGSADGVVVLVPQGVDFAEAAKVINAAMGAGALIRGVLVGGDEAVLIGNRLQEPLPVIDEVAVDRAAAVDRVLLESAPDGRALQVLADPVALSAALDLPPDALAEAEQVSREYVDARSGAVAFVRQPGSGDGQREAEAYAWIEFESAAGARERLPIAGNYRELARRIAPGSVRALCLPRRGRSRAASPVVDDQVRDFFAPDLPAILAQPLVRRGGVELEQVPAALLKGASRHEEVRALLEELSGRPVVVAANEPQAARRGALTTPAAPRDAAVCDVGGGTIDLVGRRAAVTAAGAGELLTLSVSLSAGIRRGTAERVKRHRSFRVESPSLLHDEDGGRRFADPAVHGRFVGRLCVDTGRAVLPFADRLSPEEWRALRLTLKVATIGANIERAFGALDDTPTRLILCGGCALDDELVRAVADGLRDRQVVVGRANVAGSLGSRYAVALGLVLCCPH